MRTKNELYQEALRTVALRRQTARALAQDAQAQAEAAIPALRHAEEEVRVRGIRCALAGAAGNHLAPGPLQQQHLVFNHVHHGLAGGQQVQLAQVMLPEGGGNAGLVAQQGIIIGKAARPQLHPGEVVQLVQVLMALFGRIAQGAVAA